MFSHDAIQAFRLHAIEQWPREACGIIVEQTNGNHVYVECDNIAPDPELDAVISTKDITRAHNMGKIVSMVHSHPKGKIHPSGADMEAQLQWDIPFGISTSTSDSCSKPFFFGKGVPIAPYEGRVFVNGWQDCFSLLKDWYQQELNIELPVVPHDHYWWEHNKNLYEAHLSETGFRKLGESEPLKRGDGFLMKIRAAVPNHAGVFVGNGQILHHLQDQYSLIEPLHRWRNLIWGWYRHKDMEDA